MPLKNVNYKKRLFFPTFLCHKDPLNKNNESICQILWPLSFENGLLKMKKGPKIVKNPVRKKITTINIFLYMWSHQAKPTTWMYLKIRIFSHFLTVYILNNVFCKFQVIPAGNYFRMSNFLSWCPKYQFWDEPIQIFHARLYSICVLFENNKNSRKNAYHAHIFS